MDLSNTPLNLNKVATLFPPYLKDLADASGKYIQAWIQANGPGYQLSLSLLSAVIFYLAFNVIPTQRRKSKLRPIIIADLKKLKSDLFFIFCTTMQENPFNSAGEFQHKIRGGKLRKSEMYLGIQNKCFAADINNDPEVSKALFAIDEKLRNLTNSATSQIDKIFNLSEFATPKEITLIENIRQKLHTYSLTPPPPSPFKAVIPNCSHLIYAYFPLYELYLTLADHLRSFKSIAPEDLQQLAAEYKDMGELRKCIKIYKKIKKHKALSPELDLQIALCYHLLDKKRACYKHLKQALKDGPPYNSAVSCRNTFEILLMDPIAKEIIISATPPKQMEEMHRVLTNESKHRDDFNSTNRKLAAYFATRSPGYRTIEEFN
ncbi:hypothetical protein I5P84_05635 [Pseudomonas mosselii]|uniref:hypothetical protein n=1 Tax=Pseudomonas mosselii TaxID=78327 RepID=UPI0018D7F73A|nr:hypothetical protein [Pseudomonas mosselii]MBH3308936.1 hypothetical protein [Pseudomonas mosselii]MBH3325346.1 hypothetical protein [Pseudomonas mosselii]